MAMASTCSQTLGPWAGSALQLAQGTQSALVAVFIRHSKLSEAQHPFTQMLLTHSVGLRCVCRAPSRR